MAPNGQCAPGLKVARSLSTTYTTAGLLQPNRNATPNLTRPLLVTNNMVLVNGSACYMADGSTTGYGNTGYPLVPCDATAPNSACCAVTDDCLDTGICLSGQGYFYRGGCTDASWQTPECAAVCLSASGPINGMWASNQGIS